MIWQCSSMPGMRQMGAHDQVLEPYTEFVTKTVEEDGIACDEENMDRSIREASGKSDRENFLRCKQLL